MHTSRSLKRLGIFAGGMMAFAVVWLAARPGTAVSGRTEIRGHLSLVLPPGSRHYADVGIDTWVGRIRLGGTPVTLTYDIGHVAGNYATYVDGNGPFVWTKRTEQDGIACDVSLHTANGSHTLFVSFPDLGPANFWCDVRDDSQVDGILKILKTVRPAR
ncbi:MAG: hypothetical protein KF774_14155 [Planctomyces sp.]|nr:hypothetical protein [Planctomyces sp.]